ncbi:GreA/GreB family elongation factor [Chloroflexota bacterium]
MADNDDQIPSVDGAAGLYFAQLAPDEKEKCQQEVRRFTRWFGGDRALAKIIAPEVANYAERLSLSDTDYAKKLELTKAFLAYAKKAGWCKTNLSVHLKPKKTKAGKASTNRQPARETIELTRQGYAEMETELALLKERRIVVLEEMRRAAADKDFRENAPLAAAREERGHIEGRIQELEEIFKSAVVVGVNAGATLKAKIGCKVLLCDLATGEEMHYKIVHTKEVDALHGKISTASPIGKAVINRGEGDEITVTVPAGKLRYQIKSIER